jgi:type I restriction-modification system DNA methylase subunit
MGNAGRNGGEYYTPRPLIRAIVAVTAPRIGETLCDPAVGSAGFLCEAFDYLKARNPKRTTAQDRALQERTFYGKEKKSLAYVIAIMNMILHGIEAPNILHTNTLAENLAEFIELQKSKADSPKSWSVDAAAIDPKTFDLSVKNPNGNQEVTHRSPQEIMDEIAALDAESAEVLGNIRALL